MLYRGMLGWNILCWIGMGGGYSTFILFSGLATPGNALLDDYGAVNEKAPNFFCSGDRK